MINKKNKIIIFASIIGVLNVLFTTNYIISLIIVLLELIILSYHFINKSIIKYLGNYLIFLCLSFEFGLLVGSNEFYGFKNFRIFGINLGIIGLLPILFLLINKKKISIIKIKNKSKNLYFFIKTILFLNITGVIIGLIQILINDNNIKSMDGFLSDFISVIYNKTAIPFLILLTFIYIINFESDKVEEIGDYLIAILIATVISMLASLLTGTYGYYGGVNTLLVSNIIHFIPFILLFPFYKKSKTNKYYFLIGSIGMIMTLFYNVKGKMIIIYILIPIGIFIILFFRKKLIHLFLIILFLTLSTFLLNIFLEHLIENSTMFRSKFKDVRLLFRFWNSNWLQNLPPSPRVRIIEFINIIYEYIEKPWFLIFGKGYMGTIKDHIGFLNNFISGSYSINQWDSGVFYSVHETLNSIFLNHGLFGIIIYFYIAKIVFSTFYITPWILIGGYWFLMFYGFSVTLSAFGVTALTLGFIKIDKNMRKGDYN